LARLNVTVISSVILSVSVTEISSAIVIFSSSERWTGFESESDVSWEIWNEIETEIAAAEEKGNENVTVGVIWTETLILICLVGILAL